MKTIDELANEQGVQPCNTDNILGALPDLPGQYTCEMCGKQHCHNYGGYRFGEYRLKIEVIPDHQGWCFPCPRCLRSLLAKTIAILKSLD